MGKFKVGDMVLLHGQNNEQIWCVDSVAVDDSGIVGKIDVSCGSFGVSVYEDEIEKFDLIDFARGRFETLDEQYLYISCVYFISELPGLSRNDLCNCITDLSKCNINRIKPNPFTGSLLTFCDWRELPGGAEFWYSIHMKVIEHENFIRGIRSI